MRKRTDEANVKLSDLTDPPPERTLVFIDEREDSINDCTFYVGLRAAAETAALLPAVLRVVETLNEILGTTCGLFK